MQALLASVPVDLGSHECMAVSERTGWCGLEGSIAQLMRHLKTSHAYQHIRLRVLWVVTNNWVLAYLRSCSLWEPCSHSISSLTVLPGMEAPSSTAKELSPLARDASGEEGFTQATHPQTQAILTEEHYYLI